MKRPRTSVIIDTNVVISSLWGGYPRKVIDMWQAGRMTLITTLDILSEYFDVIRNRGGMTLSVNRDLPLKAVTFLFGRKRIKNGGRVR